MPRPEGAVGREREENSEQFGKWVETSIRRVTTAESNVADGLAAAAVLRMGEANERTPLALIEELPFVEFSASPPTAEEIIEGLRIEIDDDLYGQLLRGVNWHDKDRQAP
ncbi:MAG: hypothetical protein ACM3ZC_08110 [Bacteroidota bacterium]